MSELRERIKTEVPELDAGEGVALRLPADENGREANSILVQVLLIVAFVVYFLACIISVHATQLLAAPLYFINKDYFYSYMAFTKKQFGLITNSVTQFFSPTTIRISGDASVRGQLRQTPDGRLETKFPDRLVMIANHQIYTDWLFLWWVSYSANVHGYIYIILKESLKYVPIIGPGMMFFNFIFMSRRWQKDKPRLQYRLQKLNRKRPSSSGKDSLMPMWLLIFPEGTNLSQNGRDASKKWAEKSGQPDMQHQLLPRSTGLQFCLQELQDTVAWVYDCTIAYEGVPRGKYGQDIFTLPATYFQGRAPKSVNMHWRRFAVSSIPLNDADAFSDWVLERWREKDQLLEQHHQTGRFPADEGDGQTKSGYIETTVRSSNRFEYLLIFAPTIALGLLIYGLMWVWKQLPWLS